MNDLIPVPKEQIKIWRKVLIEYLKQNQPTDSVLDCIEEMQRHIYSPPMQLVGYVSLTTTMILRSMGSMHKDAVYSVPTKQE